MSALEKFERTADEAFARYPIPHPNGYVANWYLMTVAEDGQRIALGAGMEEDAEWRVEHLLDRSKFALRSCLARVRAEASDWTSMPLPAKVIPRLYVRAQALFFAGIDHSVVSQICSSAHSGSANVREENGTFKVELVDGRLDSAYGALEAMRQSAGDFFAPHYSLFWFWNVAPDRRPAVLWQIVASTRLKERRILYEYDQDLAISLAGELHQAPFLVPDRWQFPWGGRYETTVLLNAVSVRAFYHLAAVQFGATRFALRGGRGARLVSCSESRAMD